jgi:hypothetical protein
MARYRPILAVLALAAGAAVCPAVTFAHPPTPSTLTYEFTDRTGPAGTPTEFDAVKQPGEARLDRADGDSVQADRVRAIGGASREDAGQRDGRVSSRMGLDDASIGPMKPGEKDEILPRCDAMQRASIGGVDLQERFRCARAAARAGGGGVGSRVP